MDCHESSKISANKVVVMGAGIAGLTAAHELSHRGFEVYVFEKNTIIGGMARSAKISASHQNSLTGLPAEYSWRGYGAKYFNLLDLLKTIPCDEKGKTVLDCLVPIESLLFSRKSGNVRFFMKEKKYSVLLSNIYNVIKGWKLAEFIYFLDILLLPMIVCNERICSWDSIRWIDFIDLKKLSQNSRPYLVEMLAPFYGIAYDKASTMTVINALKSFLFYVATESTVSLMNAPTNDAWFSPWKIFLEKKDVSIAGYGSIFFLLRGML